MSAPNTPTTTTTTLHDFHDGRGPVPAHQHPNGLGWVADSATVDATAYVGPDALVYGDAWVSGDALVSGDARVYGDARVSGDASLISGRALAYSFDAYPGSSGAILLRYGCCLFPLDEWELNLDRLCAEHAPNEEATYARALTALIALARAAVTP